MCGLIVVSTSTSVLSHLGQEGSTALITRMASLSVFRRPNVRQNGKLLSHLGYSEGA
jgi:hypothetical protein